MLGLSIKAKQEKLPPIDPFTKNLDGKTLELMGESAAHASNVYKIKNGNSIVGVRKIVEKKLTKNSQQALEDGNINIDSINYAKQSTPESEATHRETINEAMKYKELQALLEADKYLFPFISSGHNLRYSYLNLGYVEGEDLYSYLNKNIGNTKVFIEAMRGVTKALLWLLNNKYIHGDINSGNFYRTKDGQYKLIDLGMTRQITGDISIFKKEFEKLNVMLNSFKEGFAEGVSRLPPVPELGDDPEQALRDFYTAVQSISEGGKRKNRRQTKKNKKSKRKTRRRV